MTTIQGGKRVGQNRRAKFTAIAMFLMTAAFYVCLICGADIAWFVEYSKVVVFSLLFVVGGLTATDFAQAWRSGNRGDGGGAE